MTIRPMTPADIPAGLRLCRASKWNQLEDDWQVFLTSPNSGGFLAERDGRVIGTVFGLRYGGFGWIAMMLVDPEERGAGIGAKLMQAVMDSLSDADLIGLDATPLGEPLYRKFGFQNHFTLARTKCTIDAASFAAIPTNARPMEPSDFPSVFARDLAVFGFDRSALLTDLHRRSPECAWVSDRGYCFGRPGYLYSQIGPIVADHADAARELLAAACANLDGQLFCMDVPRLDSSWLQWLDGMGFIEERPFLRMFLGDHRHPGTPETQYAVTGPEFA